jgi:hypothetical protein
MTLWLFNFADLRVPLLSSRVGSLSLSIQGMKDRFMLSLGKESWRNKFRAAVHWIFQQKVYEYK